MDIRTFLSCQPWLVPLKAAATGGDSAEENSNSGASITDAHARAAPQPPPRKKRRRSSAASSQSNKDKGMKHTPPSVKTLVKGSLRFGASLDSPVPLPKNLLSASPGDPASSISQGLKSGNPSQQSMMAMSKSWTPKRAKQTPMILHFAPLKAKASASAELEVPTTNSSNVTTKKPPPKFADTKRNGRVVVPLEAAKKQGKVGKESTRFQYSLHLHPKHPLLLLSLQLSSDSMTNTQQQPTVYLIDPTQIASLSLPPENPEPSPVPPHVTCVFTSGCTIYFETEVVKAVDKDKAGKEPPVIGKEHKKQEDKVDKGKGPANEKKDDGEKEKAVEKVVQVKKRAEPRNSQAHLALILRKTFMSLIERLTTKAATQSLPLPRTIAISGTEYRLPASPFTISLPQHQQQQKPSPKGKRKTPSDEDLVEAALELAKKAQARIKGLLESGKSEHLGLGESVGAFARRYLARGDLGQS